MELVNFVTFYVYFKHGNVRTFKVISDIFNVPGICTRTILFVDIMLYNYYVKTSC
jgi:hypothetical protein